MGLIPPELLMMQPEQMIDPLVQQEPEYAVEPDGADEPPETSTSPEERLSELLTLFSAADDFRQQYSENSKEYYRLFVGHVDPLPPDKEGRSNLHIPVANEHIDTLRARMFKSLLSSYPYVDFKPKPQNASDIEAYSENVERAKLAAAIVNEQLEKNNIKRRMYSFITTMLIYPLAVLGVGWRYETRKVRRRKKVQDTILDPLLGTQTTATRYEEVEEEAVVWDDNEVVNIDFDDFWIDPMGTDIDSSRYVWHRVWATKPQIQRELALLERAGSGTVNDVDWEELAGGAGELYGNRADRMGIVGVNRPTSDSSFSDSDRERLGLYEVLHYWEDNRHAIIINRKIVAFEGPNPYWRHGKKPFCISTFDPLPGEAYGLTAVQLIEHLQAELNTTRNQRIDNVSFSLNKAWRVNPEADIDPSEFNSRPGALMRFRAGEAEPIVFGDVNMSGYQEEIIVRQDMENVLGVPAIVRGVTPNRKETATEVITKNNNASIRFDTKIILAEDVFKRLVYLMDCNNQQFMTAERVVRQYGPDGAETWLTVSPDAIIGEWDYVPAGSSIDPAANRDIRREQIGQMVMYATQAQQANPYLDLYELTKMWVESFDARGLLKALRTPEEVERKQMEDMQKQMAMQQMMQQQQQAAMQAEQQAMMQAQQQQAMPSQEELAMMQMLQAAQAQGGGIPAQVPPQDGIPPQALAMLALSEGVPA